MGQLEVLVGELVTVDGLSTSSVVVGEVTSLEHELGYNRQTSPWLACGRPLSRSLRAINEA